MHCCYIFLPHASRQIILHSFFEPYNVFKMRLDYTQKQGRPCFFLQSKLTLKQSLFDCFHRHRVFRRLSTLELEPSTAAEQRPLFCSTRPFPPDSSQQSSEKFGPEQALY